MRFDDDALIEALDAAGDAVLDALPFGVIGLDGEGIVVVYSAYESAAAGLTRERVLGRHFFLDIAPCMNNFMVAERLASEPALDATLDYVLTFRMRPTPVRLRLLRAPDIRRRYVLVERR